MQHPQILSVKMYEIDKPVYLLSFKEVLHSLVFFFFALKCSLHKYYVLSLEFLLFVLGLLLFHLQRGALEAFLLVVAE